MNARALLIEAHLPAAAACCAFGRALLFNRVQFSALRAENCTQRIGKQHAAAGKKHAVVMHNNATA
jgi:hypothetical protein